MKQKQRKSLLWRRVRYVILIIIKFGEHWFWISLIIVNALRSYIKHSTEWFIRYPNTSKLVKKISFVPHSFNPLLSVWLSDETLSLMFDILLQRPSCFPLILQIPAPTPSCTFTLRALLSMGSGLVMFHQTPFRVTIASWWLHVGVVPPSTEWPWIPSC